MSIRCLPRWRSRLPRGLCYGGLCYGVTGGDKPAVLNWLPRARWTGRAGECPDSGTRENIYSLRLLAIMLIGS
ncbi:hypothetical protein PISMIDRAFT_680425 [Pisolithus microcarpus 441]|uniref:Uncharacterized protein n=1 Tax=Pisolithus microcarpus 441 TaxID=765257 RepID=A0A0C9Z043_9AGAM|nr:hypothetical protein BKA83DRAFT_680425 [Pisolithus microcarpus]KIK22386.1 hypothetical protein PISMIDRAFT_680425 [Pisolithus microcarpus 441]